MISVKCTRCFKVMELLQEPRTTGYLCNSCWLLWQKKSDMLITKGSYEDELRKAFINFINSKSWS